MEILIGFILGIVASILAWYILYHKIIPDVNFFDKVYKQQTDENPFGYRYLIRFKNFGRRKVIDVECLQNSELEEFIKIGEIHGRQFIFL